MSSPCHFGVVALVGRPNVGKSSLINALIGRQVARSGATPGTTRLLNVYRIQVSSVPIGSIAFTLVDLPGYGYARGGESTQREFSELTTEFFTKMIGPKTLSRSPGQTRWLAGVIFVVDARHPGLDSDLLAHSWLTNRGYRIIVAATKVDRVTRSVRQRVYSEHESALGCSVLPVSGKTRDGTNPLWAMIVRLLADQACGPAIIKSSRTV